MVPQDDETFDQNRRWSPGDEIHGFANGHFGRDSYLCRVVEAVGPDWLVTRNIRDEAQFISRHDADAIENPQDRTYCSESEDFTGACDHEAALADLRARIGQSRVHEASVTETIAGGEDAASSPVFEGGNIADAGLVIGEGRSVDLRPQRQPESADPQVLARVRRTADPLGVVVWPVKPRH